MLNVLGLLKAQCAALDPKCSVCLIINAQCALSLKINAQCARFVYAQALTSIHASRSVSMSRSVRYGYALFVCLLCGMFVAPPPSVTYHCWLALGISMVRTFGFRGHFFVLGCINLHA